MLWPCCPTGNHHLQRDIFLLQINTFSQVKHYRKKKKIHRIELVRTVDRLEESKAIHQISLHLKRVNVRERLLGPDEGFFSQSDQRLKFHLVSISHIATPQPQTSVLGANCPLWRVSRESHFTCNVNIDDGDDDNVFGDDDNDDGDDDIDDGDDDDDNVDGDDDNDDGDDVDGDGVDVHRPVVVVTKAVVVAGEEVFAQG